ncbi:antizyme inhibitor 2 [Caerostris extrusa]|uniref:Antizyme inhibitor 2 n=1 Tax=Caerostris extrusa TaxID=172846 RepID=A0AAV4NIB6_CAEEX|nr:antizyme inhibitor 2 [Caerostris extrusa]
MLENLFVGLEEEDTNLDVESYETFVLKTMNAKSFPKNINRETRVQVHHYGHRGRIFWINRKRRIFFYKLTQEIQNSLKNNFPDGDVEFIAEPGCYCVASAVSLVTTILGKKSISTNEKSDIKKEYFLNDSFYGSFFEHHDIYHVKPVPVLAASEMKQRPKYKSRVWGQTCCSEDIVEDECVLPDMEDGELIQWPNMGAYGKGVSSTFTIVPSPADRYVFIQNSKLKLDSIPNAEKAIDYIAEKADLVQHAEEVNGNGLIKIK